jgi:hypothetical protein
MFGRNHRSVGLLATAAAGALFMGLHISPAAAALLPFDIDPDALTTTGGPFPNVTATDINGTSDAMIRQIGVSTQTETGWLSISGLTNNGVPVGSGSSRIVKPGDLGVGGTDVYGLYILFNGTINGISGFGPGATGTVGAGDYTFAMYGDPTGTNTYAAGILESNGGGVGGTNPVVTDVGGNDVVIAVGTSIAGSVGFAPVTGAPFFNVLASFIVCNGTAGQGLLGATLVIGGDAAGCGTFDGTDYFVSPSPFYELDFNSSISGSASNLEFDLLGTPPQATLNGIVADINFQVVPEPASVLLFGLGLLGTGAFARRRHKSRA